MPFAKIEVIAGSPACRVDADGASLGRTNAAGRLAVNDLSPGDHYLHVDCPGQAEVTAFVKLYLGETARIDARELREKSRLPMSPLEVAEARSRLRHLVEQAFQAHSQGNFDQAVKLLREATQLDPNNPDLHRELGILFLMNHDWQKARIEMIEALRNEPHSADAHNDLGYALEKLGHPRAALAEYRQAHRLDPADATYRKHYFDLMAQLASRTEKKKK